jgi:hypothetical protein
MPPFRSVKALQKFMLGSSAGPQPFQSEAISRPRQGLQIEVVPSHWPNGVFSAQIAASASCATLSPPAVSVIAPQSKPSSHSRNTFPACGDRGQPIAPAAAAPCPGDPFFDISLTSGFLRSRRAASSLSRPSTKNNLWPNYAAADEPVAGKVMGLTQRSTGVQARCLSFLGS